MLNICAVFKTTFLFIKTEDFVVNVNDSGILICHTFSIAPSVNYDDLRNALFHLVEQILSVPLHWQQGDQGPML
jgi:hypothetical protein